MFWKKKKQNEVASKIVLGMIMLQDTNSFSSDLFCKDFESNYDKKITESNGDNLSFAFKTNGETIIVGYMAFPIPQGDIKGTAKYAYNWKTAVDDLKDHKSHLIVSSMDGEQNQVERFKTFTQVICALSRTTNSIGVFKGNQSLLIPKDAYLSIASFMTDESLPLNLWIYFGYRINKKGNSCYTYGLKEFYKTEMEIVNSTKSTDEISEFLYNITHYILDNDVTFRDGETCGMSANEKIAIKLSKGEMLNGDTFKLIY